MPSRYITFTRTTQIPADLLRLLAAATWTEGDGQSDAYLTWAGVRYHVRTCEVIADGDRCDLTLERMS